jgi:hypothetical protein
MGDVAEAPFRVSVSRLHHGSAACNISVLFNSFEFYTLLQFK